MQKLRNAFGFDERFYHVFKLKKTFLTFLIFFFNVFLHLWFMVYIVNQVILGPCALTLLLQ